MSVGNDVVDLADPEARELIERASVIDVDAEPVIEARNLIAAAVRRRLAQGVSTDDAERLRAAREARLALEDIETPDRADASAEALLGWLEGAGRAGEGDA